MPGRVVCAVIEITKKTHSQPAVAMAYPTRTAVDPTRSFAHRTVPAPALSAARSDVTDPHAQGERQYDDDHREPDHVIKSMERLQPGSGLRPPSLDYCSVSHSRRATVSRSCQSSIWSSRSSSSLYNSITCPRASA
jgi:hypothetical protein